MLINNYNKLKTNLETLQLTKISENLDVYVDLVNKKEKNLIDALYELTKSQVNFKDENAKLALVKVAGFPYNKTFDDFDFEYQPTINKEEVLDLKNLRFIEKKENILLVGSSGVGKTHLAISVGMESAKNRLSTYFITCYDLIQNLKKASLENRLEQRMKVYQRYKVLIIDEIGYLPIEADEANLLFQLINKRYEKNTTIITTNITFDKWGKLFKDATIASAILDRLLHHSIIINISGNSYRIKDKIQTITNDEKSN